MQPPKTHLLDTFNFLSKTLTQKLQFIRKCDQQLTILDTQASQLRQSTLSSLVKDNNAMNLIIEKHIKQIATKHSQIKKLSKRKQQAASELFKQVNEYYEELKSLRFKDQEKDLDINTNKVGLKQKLGVIQGNGSDNFKGDICYCKQYRFDEMIKCSNETCKIGLYHKSCVERSQVKFDWKCKKCLNIKKVINPKKSSDEYLSFHPKKPSDDEYLSFHPKKPSDDEYLPFHPKKPSDDEYLPYFDKKLSGNQYLPS